MKPSAPTGPSPADRRTGGLYGLLIGDALGVPYEFHPPTALPPFDAIDMTPPAGFPRAHRGTPPGTWSDDGAQALCLLASLIQHDRLDLDDFAHRLVNWHEYGYMAVDGRVYDVGIQTREAIQAIIDGTSPLSSGPAAENRNGNGALMRVLPLALWHRGEDAELIRLAADQSLPTHGHPRSQVACAMYCLWARAELHGLGDASWAQADARLIELGGANGLPQREIAHILDPVNRAKAAGSGYVLDTLWSARIALERGSDFASVVRHAIGFGHDTDTTAAVAGGIAGTRYGIHAIPTAWRSALRGHALLEPLLRALA